MKKKTRRFDKDGYEYDPWDDDPVIGERVKDFLPSPKVLAKAIAEKRFKITIALDYDTVEFFKEAAEKHHVPYQKMIRKVLDEYKTRFEGQA